MLSQLAWRIGRTFTAGRKDAPSEFVAIEAEVNGLSKALKLLGEALFATPEINLLAETSEATRQGVGKLLNTCRRTLNDLDSLVTEYQVTIKTTTGAGFTVERLWSPLVLSNYKDMMWTPEGGDIMSLKDLLRMHRITINLTAQALNRYCLSPVTTLVFAIDGRYSVNLSPSLKGW